MGLTSPMSLDGRPLAPVQAKRVKEEKAVLFCFSPSMKAATGRSAGCASKGVTGCGGSSGWPWADLLWGIYRRENGGILRLVKWPI